MRETVFDAKPATIADIISYDRKYEIPRFQRAYAWKKDQIEQFLIDVDEVTSNYKGNEDDLEEYFFGSMVFVKTDKHRHFIIVDGQQRLATICIFIAVIRDILTELNDQKAATETGSFIVQSSYARDTPLYRIRLSDRNADYFNDFIMNSGLPQDKIKKFKQTKSYNKWIHYAYTRFYDKLTTKIKDIPKADKGMNLYHMCYALVWSFKVITITVENKTDAYRIFETLNQRGLELSITDLLKNFVLEKCGQSNEQLIYSKWEEIIDIMEKDDLDMFLRHHWMANHDKTLQKYALYKEINDSVKTEDDVKKYTDSLYYFAHIYHGLLSPQKEFDVWNQDKQLIEILNNLSILNSKVCYPLLMIARKEYDNNDFKLLANACLKFFFRSKTICDVHATALEKLIVSTANRLRIEKLPYDKVISVLKNDPIYPDDQKFQSSFIGSKTKKVSIAKYILSSIEIELQGGSKAEVIPINEITLEHIMPQTPSSDWKKSDPNFDAEHQNLLHRLGNLTLLAQPQNSKLSNFTFDKKLKQVYSNSSLKITSSLTKYAGNTWNVTTINQREKDFAKLALNIWKL